MFVLHTERRSLNYPFILFDLTLFLFFFGGWGREIGNEIPAFSSKGEESLEIASHCLTESRSSQVNPPPPPPPTKVVEPREHGRFVCPREPRRTRDPRHRPTRQLPPSPIPQFSCVLCRLRHWVGVVVGKGVELRPLSVLLGKTDLSNLIKLFPTVLCTFFPFPPPPFSLLPPSFFLLLIVCRSWSGA